MDEYQLIALVINKDEPAFKKLVELYSDKVYNTVVSIVQHIEDAEDLTQEVFIEIYNSASKFKGNSHPGTWIYRIAVSKSLDFIKSKKRHKRFAFFSSLFGDEGILLTADKPHFDHPGVILENKEHAKMLFHAVSKLPENQQIVYTLSKIECLTYTEVAEVMNMTVSSVESLLFRANQNLRKHLENYYSNLY